MTKRFKDRVRKAVGDCYNQVRFINEALLSTKYTAAAGAYTYDSDYCRMFRIISGWMGTRESMIRIINTFSTDAQVEQNQHVWPRAWKTRIRLANPNNNRIRFRLYKLTLKCDDAGLIAGEYDPTANPPVLPFASGSANVDGNAPYAGYWKFFDQSTREPNTALAPVQTTTADEPYCHNRYNQVLGTVVYDAPLSRNWIANQIWERTTPGTGYLSTWKDKLGFIFPSLRKKLRIKCVMKGVLGPYATRSKIVKNRVPPELRPVDWQSDGKTNYIGNVSHFYFLRAEARELDHYVTNQTTAGGASSGTSGLAGGQQPNYPAKLRFLPFQIVMRMDHAMSVRTATDGQPTFIFCENPGFGPPHANGASQATTWISNEGLIDEGLRLTSAINDVSYVSASAQKLVPVRKADGPVQSSIAAGYMF